MNSKTRPNPPHSTVRHALASLLAAAALAAAAPSPAVGPVPEGADKPGSLTICHGFGCRYQDTAWITDEEWRQIQAFFNKPAATPAAERDQIRRAAGWFEVIAGRHTPIHLDKGKNAYPGRFEKTTSRRGGGRRGQMDCIDESLNMTAYLEAMERARLFQHHKVVERALRRSAVDQHYAGQIEELESGARWVVDSWFYDYGSLPYMEESREWHDIPFLFSTSFPESADD